MGVDDVADAPDDVVLARILLAAQPDAAVLHMHQGELHPHQGDALDHELAVQEGRGGQTDRRLGGAGDDAAPGIGDAGAQHHQVDPALVAAPFDGGLVIIQVDARQRVVNRPGQGAPQGPSDTGPHSRRRPAPATKNTMAATSTPAVSAARLIW